MKVCKCCDKGQATGPWYDEANFCLFCGATLIQVPEWDGWTEERIGDGGVTVRTRQVSPEIIAACNDFAKRDKK